MLKGILKDVYSLYISIVNNCQMNRSVYIWADIASGETWISLVNTSESKTSRNLTSLLRKKENTNSILSLKHYEILLNDLMAGYESITTIINENNCEIKNLHSLYNELIKDENRVSHQFEINNLSHSMIFFTKLIFKARIEEELVKYLKAREVRCYNGLYLPLEFNEIINNDIQFIFTLSIDSLSDYCRRKRYNIICNTRKKSVPEECHNELMSKLNLAEKIAYRISDLKKEIKQSKEE